MKFKFFYTILFITSTTVIYSFQDNSQLEKITKKLADYVKLESPEKTYLHTDKDVYSPGDTIWFKTYLVDGITHKKSDKSRVAYVELLNASDSILAKRILYIEGTSSFGSIDLPNNLVDDNYKLRTYTKYMLNDEEMPFYQKMVTISRKWATSLKNNAEEKARKEIGDTLSNQYLNQSKMTINIKFFPEGGNLVAGLSGGLAFKVSDSDGNPIALHGTINDSKGNVITNFNSNEHGLGNVYFLPEPGHSYFALIDNNGFQERFEISTVLDQGFSLSIKNRGNNILIQVETADKNLLDGTILIGHLRGKKIFERLEKNNKSKSYAVKLLMKDLPDGVVNFTLFSREGKPVCERLVFIENPFNDPKVSIQTNAINFGKREKVELAISVNDAMGRPIMGDFSMRISSSMVLTRKSDMKNWLLLNTDLDGLVNYPNLFFEEHSKETELLLDALMLTHKWGRFSWDNLLDSHRNLPTVFEVEKGIMINGTVTDLINKTSVEKNMISLSILSEAFVEKQEIDEKGKFQFGPYRFNSDITPILQIVGDNKKGAIKQKNIVIDSQWPSILLKIDNTNPSEIKYLKIPKSIEFNFKGDISEEYESDITYLDEVVVKEKQKTISKLIEEEIRSFTPYGSPDQRIFRDSVKGWQTLSAMELLEKKGILVRGSLFGGAPSSVNFKTGPLILVDGQPVSGSQLMASEVLFIDILRFASASLYGVRGSQGVIAIYTDRTLRSVQNWNEFNPKITSTDIMGFNEKLEFYSPDYSGKNQFNALKNYRSTLYWSPDVKIDNKGQGKIQFYTNDRTGKFTIELEGLTEDGEIVHGSYDIEVSY